MYIEKGILIKIIRMSNEMYNAILKKELLPAINLAIERMMVTWGSSYYYINSDMDYRIAINCSILEDTMFYSYDIMIQHKNKTIHRLEYIKDSNHWFNSTNYIKQDSYKNLIKLFEKIWVTRIKGDV